MSLPLPAAVHGEIHRSRILTDGLFLQIKPDAMYDRPIMERHRLIFYLGHLEAFDWNLLRQALDLEPVNAELDPLFARGIDPAPGELPHDTARDWPSLADTQRYVATVRTELDKLWCHANDEVLSIALEHRLMHAETLTYMIHNLPYSRRITRMRGVPSNNEPPPVTFIKIPAGNATLGRRRGNGYGWDNEFDLHQVRVEEFAISRYKVTNGQYLDFVKEGGQPPHYWILKKGEWRYRGYNGEAPLPADLPVYVSHNQASAYARWLGKSLPTEAQFHRAAYGAPGDVEHSYPWGSAPPQPVHGSFNFTQDDLVPVTAHQAGASGFGASQLTGNGWEWTSSKFKPFEGFTPEPLYPTYSSDFFDDRHYVVKGASCVTHQRFLRRSFRNWFRPHYRYAYTTFRLVEN